MENENVAEEHVGLLPLIGDIEEPLSPLQHAELVRKVNMLSFATLVQLASQWDEDFQPIHKNITEFYAMGGPATPEQKTVMVDFVLDHPELMDQVVDWVEHEDRPVTEL